MSPIGLTLVLLITLTLRLLFIGTRLSDLNSLWADYERRGLKFRLAQWLDWITLGGFAIPAVILLYKINSLAYPLTTTFIGFLGIQLLSRLKVSRFPRTNLPGAFTEAKINLIVHIMLSFAGAAGVTLLATIYLWWQK
jgi:hypothetical protein